jgi:hypothetical protein
MVSLNHENDLPQLDPHPLPPPMGKIVFHSIQALAEAEKLPFLETSALKNVNVEEAFTVILSDIYKAATRKIFAEDDLVEKDLGGTRIELNGNKELQRPGLWSYSCCGTITKFLTGGKEAAKEA